MEKITLSMLPMSRLNSGLRVAAAVVTWLRATRAGAIAPRRATLDLASRWVEASATSVVFWRDPSCCSTRARSVDIWLTLRSTISTTFC